MSRYIDADNLKNAKRLIADNPYVEGWNDAIDAIVECAPTTDVRPNVHGEWIEWQKCTPFYIQNLYKCSKCNESYLKELVYFSDNLQYRFCPNCGAEMRGVRV